MKQTSYQSWYCISALLLTLTIISTHIVPIVSAEETSGTLISLRPHCEKEDATACSAFEIKTPQSLQTPRLKKGDTLDIDIIVHNPGKDEISSVRSWLQYDATILEGSSIAIETDSFPRIAPGESDFNAQQGYVMIHVTADDDNLPKDTVIVVARVKFTVVKEVSPGTVVKFHDIQPSGHTALTAGGDAENTNIMDTDPPQLLVILGNPKTETNTPLQNGATCSTNDQCNSDNCTEKKCTAAVTLLDDGAKCTQDEACKSGTCIRGACGSPEQSSSVVSTNDSSASTVVSVSSVQDEQASSVKSTKSCAINHDCGGNICYQNVCQAEGFKIPSNGPCKADADCASGACRNLRCSDAVNVPVGDACTTGIECESGICSDGICLAAPASSAESTEGTNGQTCTENSDCISGICTNNICRQPGTKVPNGGACVIPVQCKSNLCVEGICRDANDRDAQRTAFSLLQVGNFRATTEGSSVFLAWEDLKSSFLKGYNVYYGTTSGQYIHRKTLPASSSNVTIRNLPKDTKYFFAIRAISTTDEEGAFNQEVSIVVDNPASSTAPLVANVTTDAPKENPIDDTQTDTVPGETGASSLLVILLLLSAVIGTFLASRRQLIARVL